MKVRLSGTGYRTISREVVIDPSETTRETPDINRDGDIVQIP